MLNGLSFLNKKHNSKPRKVIPVKGQIAIIAIAAAVAITNLAYQFFNGDEQQKHAIINNFKNNFHISIIDISILVIISIALLVLKIKNNKK